MTNTDFNTSLSTFSGQDTSIDGEKATEVTVSISMSLEAMIADNAKALTSDDLPNDLKELGKSGLLSPVGGLGQIHNRCDDRIHAGIYVDEKQNRYIHFRQQYSDGTFSPEFVIPQEALFIVATYNRTGNPMMKQEAQKAIRSITKEYLRKLSSTELLNIPEVMDALFDAFRQIPVVSREHELTRLELYAEVTEVLKNLGVGCSRYEIFREEKRGYLALDDSTIADISREMQLPRKQLLEQLKKNQLLYLTGSCRGYQSKIPYGRKPDGTVKYEWAYCLYDLEYLNKHANCGCPPAEIESFDNLI